MGLDGSRLGRTARSTPLCTAGPGVLALLALCGVFSSPAATAGPGQGEAKPRPPSRPDLTDPVVCLNVQGFRDLVPREEPELTRDEKLQIYYEPFNYVIVRGEVEGGGDDEGRNSGRDRSYRAHLTQDIRIRRAGGDRVLRAESAIIDYVAESRDPPTSTYMLTTLSLKEFSLGAYEVDLVLRDELAEGRPEVVRTVSFRVVDESVPPPDRR